MSRDLLRRLPGSRRPTAPRLVREGYARLRRTLRKLEQQGSIEARQRPDKHTGYWPTKKGLQELKVSQRAESQPRQRPVLVTPTPSSPGPPQEPREST